MNEEEKKVEVEQKKPLKRLFLGIDIQKDFTEVGAPLYVNGANNALERINSWIRINADLLTEIMLSQDDHYTTQIGMPHAWNDERGHIVDPFTKISSNEVRSGKYKPVYLDKDYVIKYLETIEAKGAEHTIWPEHCIHGTPGQQFPDVIIDALTFWGEKNNKHYETWCKGATDNAEMYSVFSYANEDKPTGVGIHRLDRIAAGIYDVIYVAGFAKDICVAESVKDLIKDGRFEGKLVFCDFGMSAINTLSTNLAVYEDAVKNHGAKILTDWRGRV